MFVINFFFVLISFFFYSVCFFMLVFFLVGNMSESLFCASMPWSISKKIVPLSKLQPGTFWDRKINGKWLSAKLCERSLTNFAVWEDQDKGKRSGYLQDHLAFIAPPGTYSRTYQTGDAVWFYHGSTWIEAKIHQVCFFFIFFF